MSGSDADNGERSATDAERIEALERGVRHAKAQNEALRTQIQLLREVVVGDRIIGEDEVENAEDVFSRLTSIAEGLARHDDLLDAVTEIESESTSKDGKVSQIVTFARRKCDPNQDQIVVTAKEIRGCTGVSLRYAYDLIDSLGEKYDWAGVRNSSTVPGSSASDRKRQKAKGLKIDFTEFNRSETIELVQQQGGPEGGA